MSTDPANNIIAGIGQRLVASAKTSRQRFMESGREIMRYGYAPDYAFEYTKKAPNAFFKAKVALTAEAFRVFGPYLFPQVPVRVVSPREFASPEGIRRAELMEDYLNYTPGETGLREQARRAILEALGYGRGVLWVGRHPRTGLMCSTWDSVRNFLTDPDARTPEERKFVGRKRVRPRFEVLAEMPEARETIMREKVYEARPTDSDGAYSWENQDTSAECICYYELYLRVGIHNFKGGDKLAQLAGKKVGDTAYEVDDAPRKLCVTESGKFLYSGEWEIPFYEDGLFPSNELDFLDNPDSDWPQSVLAAGLGWQRAINWVVTMLMGKYRYTSRTIGAIAKNGSGVSQKDKDNILKVGGDIEMIEIVVNGETKTLQNYIMQFDFNHSYLDVGMKFLNLMEEKFQKATGLYDILYAGDTGRQIRSAKEAQLKERNSQSGLDEMRDRVTEWMNRSARMEALGARFHHNRQEIAAILGPQAGQDWGFLVRPEAADVQVWAEQYVAEGMEPEQAVQLAQQQMQQAVSLDQWRNEVDYSIESSSTRRNDIDTRIDALREMMNQTVPTQLQSMDPAERAMAYETMAEFYKLIGATPALVQAQVQMAQFLRSAPPPMMAPPIPGPGAQQQGGM